MSVTVDNTQPADHATDAPTPAAVEQGAQSGIPDTPVDLASPTDVTVADTAPSVDDAIDRELERFFAAQADAAGTPTPGEVPAVTDTEPVVDPTDAELEPAAPQVTFDDILAAADNLTPEELARLAALAPAPALSPPPAPPGSPDYAGPPTFFSAPSPSTPAPQSAASGSGDPGAVAPQGSPAVPGSDLPTTPAPAALPPLPDLSVFSELAPELAPYLESLAAQQQQVAQQTAWFQQQQAQQAQYLAQQEQARVTRLLEAGDAQFRAEHADLTDQDFTALSERVVNLQLLPALVHQHGDVTVAYKEALTTAMFSDPQYRDRLIQTRVDQYANDSREIEQRRQRAASIGGTGGSVPRVPTQAAASASELTPQQRTAAIAAEIAGGGA